MAFRCALGSRAVHQSGRVIDFLVTLVGWCRKNCLVEGLNKPKLTVPEIKRGNGRKYSEISVAKLLTISIEWHALSSKAHIWYPSCCFQFKSKQDMRVWHWTLNGFPKESYHVWPVSACHQNTKHNHISIVRSIYWLTLLFKCVQRTSKMHLTKMLRIGCENGLFPPWCSK